MLGQCRLREAGSGWSAGREVVSHGREEGGKGRTGNGP